MVVIFLAMATLLLFSRSDGAYTAYQPSALPDEGFTSLTTSDARVSDATQTQDVAALTFSITTAQSAYLTGEPLTLDIQLARAIGDLPRASRTLRLTQPKFYPG